MFGKPEAASSKQATSTCEIGKNQSSAVVLVLWPIFWWMLLMCTLCERLVRELLNGESHANVGAQI